jgi:hypothetical protein
MNRSITFRAAQLVIGILGMVSPLVTASLAAASTQASNWVTSSTAE